MFWFTSKQIVSCYGNLNELVRKQLPEIFNSQLGQKQIGSKLLFYFITDLEILSKARSTLLELLIWPRDNELLLVISYFSSSPETNKFAVENSSSFKLYETDIKWRLAFNFQAEWPRQLGFARGGIIQVHEQDLIVLISFPYQDLLWNCTQVMLKSQSKFLVPGSLRHPRYPPSPQIFESVGNMSVFIQSLSH